MAKLLLVHVVSRKKIGQQEVLKALEDITRNRRLLCGTGGLQMNGIGVYAYYANRILNSASVTQQEAMVVFEIDAARVTEAGPQGRRYAFIRPLPTDPTGHIDIDFLGLVNPPPGYEAYEYTGPSVL
jgi:hypothetical protein